MKIIQEPDWLCKLCDYFYGFQNDDLRKIIRKVLLRRRGADFYSKILRSIFLKYHHIDVGMYTHFGFRLEFPPGTVIGRYSSIDSRLLVINGSHPIKHQSSHAFFFDPNLGYADRKAMINTSRTKLLIGHDAYIGLNATIMPSVSSIGNGSVIAAGSVVVKDVPPFAIVGGNPAKIIKYRFSQKTIDQITQSAWWDKDILELKNNPSEFERFFKDLE